MCPQPELNQKLVSLLLWVKDGARQTVSSYRFGLAVGNWMYRNRIPYAYSWDVLQVFIRYKSAAQESKIFTYGVRDGYL